MAIGITTMYNTLTRLQQFTRHRLFSKRCVQVRHPVRYFTKTSICNNTNERFRGFYNVTPKSGAKLQLKDCVPKDYNLIYRGPLETYMKFGYPIMAFFTVLGPAFVFYKFYTKGELVMEREDVPFPITNPEVEIYIFAGCLLLCALMFFSIIFKTPVRIYKHQEEKKYIAMFLSSIPLKCKQFHFSSASVTTFRNPLYSLFPECQYIIGDRKVILFSNHFRLPVDYLEMLGED